MGGTHVPSRPPHLVTASVRWSCFLPFPMVALCPGGSGSELHPPNLLQGSRVPEPQSMAAFGRRWLQEKLVKMGSPRSRVGPTPCDWGPCETGNGYRQDPRGLQEHEERGCGFWRAKGQGPGRWEPWRDHSQSDPEVPEGAIPGHGPGTAALRAETVNVSYLNGQLRSFITGSQEPPIVRKPGSCPRSPGGEGPWRGALVVGWPPETRHSLIVPAVGPVLSSRGKLRQHSRRPRDSPGPLPTASYDPRPRDLPSFWGLCGAPALGGLQTPPPSGLCFHRLRTAADPLV